MKQKVQLGRGGVAAVAGAAVMGLAAGLVASAGRKAALQAAEAAVSGDWVDALKAEHLELIELFDLIEQAGPIRVMRRRKLAQRLKDAFDKHAFQEENVIYPALKAAGLSDAAHELVDDHAELKALFYQLERADPADPAWEEVVQRLREAAEAHMREEEETAFPALRSQMTDAESVELTALMLKNGAKLIP